MADEPANQLIKADGTSEEFLPADGEKYALEELQAAVGGYIERLYLPDGRYLLVDEDGRPKGLPMNNIASSLYRSQIVGDVVVCQARFFDDQDDDDE